MEIKKVEFIKKLKKKWKVSISYYETNIINYNNSNNINKSNNNVRKRRKKS